VNKKVGPWVIIKVEKDEGGYHSEHARYSDQGCPALPVVLYYGEGQVIYVEQAQQARALPANVPNVPEFTKINYF
jgi:hypothetical protein